MNINEQSLSKLKCARCHLHLSVGTVTVSSNYFYCGRCPSGGVPVDIYEVLAEKFAFPCRYSSFGCQETIQWGSVQLHEQKCSKKPHLCPMVPAGVCLWRGAMDEIPQHFEQKHAEDVTDMNIIELKLHDNVEGCKLIKHSGVYLFHVCFNKSQKVLKLNLIGLNVRKGSEGRYRLKLHSCNFSQHLALAECQLQYYESMDHSNANENTIDVGVLKFLMKETPSIFCEIIFETDTNKANSDFLKLLRCPVCKVCMASPIYQCKVGHSFCNSCVSKLQDCSVCQEELTQTRNYALEDLSNQLCRSCRNKDAGCTFVAPSDELNRHEANCNIYKCPLASTRDCNWSGDFDALLAHCKRDHVYLDLANDNRWVCDLTVSRSNLFLHTDGALFRLSQKTKNDEFYISVHFVGPSEQAGEYSYEFSFVSINSDSDSNTELCLKDTCHVLTNDDEMFSNSFRVPLSMLRPFQTNSKLTCDVKIIKQNAAAAKPNVC